MRRGLGKDRNQVLQSWFESSSTRATAKLLWLAGCGTSLSFPLTIEELTVAVPRSIASLPGHRFGGLASQVVQVFSIKLAWLASMGHAIGKMENLICCGERGCPTVQGQTEQRNAAFQRVAHDTGKRREMP